jgi:hypothetical protein
MWVSGWRREPHLERAPFLEPDRLLSLIVDGGSIAIGTSVGADLHRQGLVELVRGGRRYSITRKGTAALRPRPGITSKFQRGITQGICARAALRAASSPPAIAAIVVRKWYRMTAIAITARAIAAAGKKAVAAACVGGRRSDGHHTQGRNRGQSRHHLARHARTPLRKKNGLNVRRTVLLQ